MGLHQLMAQFDTNNVPVALKQFRKDAAITEGCYLFISCDAVDKLLQDLFAEARLGVGEVSYLAGKMQRLAHLNTADGGTKFGE